MQSNGSLAETDLRTLLETAQSERATGTLNVRNGGGGACTLYFLFGHLFHAVGEGTLGDEAVIRALNWSVGEYEFDAKAKLPADETVRGSIPDLVSQAGTGQAAEKAPPPSPSVTPPVTPPPIAFPPPGAVSPFVEPAPNPPAPPAPIEGSPRVRSEAVSAKPAEPPHPRRGVKHRPQPRHGREPIPVPAGQVVYDSLKTSFVDFPRLITTLEREEYTGYVRLLTEDAAGLILFKDGHALECAYDEGEDPGITLGAQALAAFNDAVTNGEGILDVVSLTPELVDGLYELTAATPIYSDLYASWVDPEALLEFLEKRGLSGTVTVHTAASTGVIILTQGRLTGAYTSDSRDIADEAEGVLRLCTDKEAMIEVKAAQPGQRTPLDVDAIVGSHREPTGTTQAGIPIYRPEAGAPAPTSPPAPPEPAPAVFSQAQPPQPAWPAASGTGSQSPQQQGWPPDQTPPTQPAVPVPTAPTPAALPALDASGLFAQPRPALVPGVAGQDWEPVLAELQAMTEEALGNRARKVKDVLASAERTPEGLEAAIDQIPTISILFVDSSRLEALAHDLKAKLHSYLA